MADRLRGYLRDAARAFALAPVEVALGLAVAIAFSVAVEQASDGAWRVWGELAIGAALAGAVAWSSTLLHALRAWSPRRRWIVTLAGVAAAAAYAGFVLRLDRLGEAWRAGMLVAAAALAVTIVPAAARAAGATAEARFRRVNLRFFSRAIGTGLYSAALFIGLALALRAVDALFALGLDRDLYAHVFGFIAFALAPWIVVGGVSAMARPVDGPSEAGPGLRRFAAYLLLPLLIVYYTIIYAYAVRIGITGELPHNLISPLVLAAGVLGALGVILFTPPPAGPMSDAAPPSGTGAAGDATVDRSGGTAERDDAAVRGDVGAAARGVRLAPVLFLPLGALGVWAILLRIGQYGWTEFRYVRLSVLAGLIALAVAGTLVLVRRRAFRVQLIPLVLAVVLALSAVGPWGALAVSERSQRARLVAGLETAGVLDRAGDPGDRPVAAPAADRRVPNEVYDQVASTGRYLVRHFGPDAAIPPLPAEFRELPATGDAAARLGLRRAGPDAAPTAPALARLEGGVPTDALADGTLHPVRFPTRPPTRPDAPGAPGSRRAEFLPDSAVLRLVVADEPLHADLSELLAWLGTRTPADVPPPGPGPRPLPPRARAHVLLPPERAVVEVTDLRGQARGRLVVFDIAVRSGDDGTGRLLRLEGVLGLEADTAR